MTTELHFECPSCERPIETPAEMSGQKITCPDCSQEMVVPADARSRAYVAPFSERKSKPQNKTKPCEACQQPIGPRSLVCPNCGEIKYGLVMTALYIVFAFMLAGLVMSFFLVPLGMLVAGMLHAH